MPRAKAQPAAQLEVVESAEPPPQLLIKKRTRTMTPEALAKLAEARKLAIEARRRKGELTRTEKQLEKEIAQKAEQAQAERIEKLRQIRDERSPKSAAKPPVKPKRAPARRAAPPPPEASEPSEASDASESADELEPSDYESEEEAPPPPRRVQRARAQPKPAPRAKAAPVRRPPPAVSHDAYYHVHQHPEAVHPQGGRQPLPRQAAAEHGDAGDFLKAFFPQVG